MQIKNIRPTGSKVLMRVFEWPDKSKGGIWLPDMLKYSSTRGGKDPWRSRILAVGPKVEQVNPGEIIRYQPDNYSRQTIYDDNYKRYIIINESLIYAVEGEDEILIRALENRFVFLPDKDLPEKYGSIYLPQRREEPLLYGIIVVAGKHVGVVAGDRVVLENKNTWQYFDSAGKRYILTDKFNLLAKINKYCECAKSTAHSAGTLLNGTDLVICQECDGEMKID